MILVHHPKNEVKATYQDADGELLSFILIEFTPLADGLDGQFTFVFPKETPDSFLKAHADHSLEEGKRMVEIALPHLKQRAFGYLIPTEQLTLSSVTLVE